MGRHRAWKAGWSLSTYILWDISKLVERGLGVDVAVVRAMSEEKPRVAGGMKPRKMSMTLWGTAKLVEKGVEVDLAAVQAMN